MKLIIALILGLALTCCNCYADYDEDDGGKDFPQVFHVYDYVDMVTTERYVTEQNPKIAVKSVYPQLEGDENDQAIAAFNTQVRAVIKQEIAAFRAKIKELQQYSNKLTEQSPRSNLFIDYNSSAIKPGDDHIISIRFSVQGFISTMAHPYHYHRVINFDLDTGEPIELNDLFTPDADYLTILSTLTRGSLNKHLANKEMVSEGTQPTPANFKNWNIRPDGLLITFDEYQVAPYVNGAQTVLIPFPELKTVIAPDSLLAECTDHPSKCRRGKLLTGGFIDEAANTHHTSKTTLSLNNTSKHLNP